MSDETAFECWAIIELMGHRRLAGFLAEQQIAGAGFLRLDVHGAGGAVATQFYTPASVYCITPTTEEIARKLGDKARPMPVTRYELEPRRPACGEVERQALAIQRGDFGALNYETSASRITPEREAQAHADLIAALPPRTNAEGTR